MTFVRLAAVLPHVGLAVLEEMGHRYNIMDRRRRWVDQGYLTPTPLIQFTGTVMKEQEKWCSVSQSVQETGLG